MSETMHYKEDNINLTIGKIRGLTATSSEAGVFTILAFDHRQSFARMLTPRQGETIPYAEIVNAKLAVVEALSPHASAVLLDPEYSAAQSIACGVLPGRTGLVVAIEKTGYSGVTTARESNLLSGWSVAKIKRMGADAVKLLIYYHPNAGDLTQRQEKLTRDVIQDCRRYDIAFYLEPISYSIDPKLDKSSKGFAVGRLELIRDIASRLGALEPDVLKLEFPVDVIKDPDERSWAQACEMVSEAAGCPWVVLSAGVDFDMFKRQVEIACRWGAAGYIAGRAVWKEGIPLPPTQRDDWLRNVAVARLDQLSEIADRYARPWRDIFPGIENNASQGWLDSYTGFS
jgi:tagatose 1,6-diphosphate aldolase